MSFPNHIVYGGSFVGRRDHNEDSIFPQNVEKISSCYIVCDGMGGHAHGKLASMTAGKKIYEIVADIDSEEIAENLINKGYKLANDALSEMFESKDLMGTTAATVVLTENTCFTANIGDSRIYIFRDGKEIFRTFDDSQVFDLVKKGIITKEKAHDDPKKNIITRSLSSRPSNNGEPKIKKLKPLLDSDRIIICSDGVWDCFPQGDPNRLIDMNSDLKLIHREIMRSCSHLNWDNYSFFLLGDFQTGNSNKTMD